MIVPAVFLVFLTLQRVGELALARRNTRRLLAQGAVESGRAHYPLIVAVHAAWLAGLWLLAWGRTPDLAWLWAYGVVEALRIWTLASLGERWTTRIVTLPGAPRVRRGPYRLLPHPNYLVVAAEIAIAPMIFRLPLYAVVFSGLNAVLMCIRIPAENAALRTAEPPSSLVAPGSSR